VEVDQNPPDILRTSWTSLILLEWGSEASLGQHGASRCILEASPLAPVHAIAVFLGAKYDEAWVENDMGSWGTKGV
jgi:hypothetical protein